MTDSHLFQNLRKVVSLVDRLRDIGMQKYISLPRIAVVGTQSAGKSSLLEQIVGLDFLPRGSGVVTRRPLELRLVYQTPFETDKPYAVFEELKDKKLYDFAQVKQTIEQLTDKVAGSKKGIVDKPIILTIYSSSCPDLTLIDLPGITRIPMQGTDQNEDIEKVTKDMAVRYIKDPNTIILAVTPANQDLSTADGLNLARKIDPKGVRTLGVFTKIDIMDKGVDAKSMLLGKDYPLKLGYVGVINRTQEDINNNKPIKKHLEDERVYFSKHPVYSTLNRTLVGTESLTNRLSELLYQHIRRFLPRLNKEMDNQIREREKRLKELGPGLPETDKDRMRYLFQLVNQFIVMYNTSISGTYDKQNAKRNELPVGSRVREILLDLYTDESYMAICKEYNDEQIQRAIIMHDADTIPGFISSDAFLALLVPQLHKLKQPAEDAINEVFQMLEEVTNKILEKVCEKVPTMKTELYDKILSHLMTERDKTKDIVDNIINSEIHYQFTNDLDYMYAEKDREEKNKKGQGGDQAAPPSGVSRDPMVNELRRRIDQYFSIVIRGIRDTVPKMIGNFLVRGSQERMRTILFEATQRSDQFFKLMEEPKHIVEERKELAQSLKVMNEAKDLIRKDPDLSVMFNARLADDDIDPNAASEVSTDADDSNAGTPDNSRGKQGQAAANKPAADSLFGGPKQTSAPTTVPQQRPAQSPAPGNQQQGITQQRPAGAAPNAGGAAPGGAGGATAAGGAQAANKAPSAGGNMANMFGSNAPAKPAQPAQQSTGQLTGQDKRDMFGQQASPAQAQPNAQQQQQQQAKAAPKTTNFFGGAVDKVMDDPKVQNKVAGAAGTAAYAAVDSQIPIRNADGKNPIAEAAAKGAQEAAKNPQVQDAAKQAVKQGAQDAAKEATGKKWW